MNLPPELEAKCLALATNGNGVVAMARQRHNRRKPALVEAAYISPNVWVVPCEVPSLLNARDWHLRNRVAQAHRRAVSRALGPHLAALAPFATAFHAGGALVVTLTRLGGRALDRFDNLPASLKYCADAVCLLIGADDADARLEFRHGQEPGGACGVRIQIQTQEA